MSHLKLLGQLRKALKHDTVSLFYHGIFDDDFTDKFIAIASFDSERKVKGKMAFVLAESFQNIIRHKDEELDDDNSNSFGLRGRDDWMHIFSSNLIDENSKKLLEESLEGINSMNEEELKDVYLEILERGQISEKGGAGLGLIEMARRSRNPLQYEIITQEGGKYAFNMQVDFERNPEDTIEVNLSIEENSELNDNILEDGIVFIYKGEFSDDVLQPMIPIIESNAAVEGTLSYSIFHIAVELMQNIGRHGEANSKGKKMGIFALKKLQDGYYLCSGNYTESDVDELKSYVMDLNVRDVDYLNDLYKKALKESVITNVNSAKVGLIDIKRTSGNPINIKVAEDAQGKYLMIGIKIST